MTCLWCDRPAPQRHKGGPNKRFCREACRREFHTSLRIAAYKAFEVGVLS